MGKYKILFVDDDDLILKMVSLSLSSISSKLVTAPSGVACMEELKKDSDYDIVLLDFMLPDINGLEVLTKIRKDKKIRHLPVLIQTGICVVDKPKIRRLGSDIIFKPYSRDDLCDAIDKMISKKK